MQSEKYSPDALQRFRKFLQMSDKEFADIWLTGLTEEELSDFCRECPDFPKKFLSDSVRKSL